MKLLTASICILLAMHPQGYSEESTEIVKPPKLSPATAQKLLQEKPIRVARETADPFAVDGAQDDFLMPPVLSPATTQKLLKQEEKKHEAPKNDSIPEDAQKQTETLRKTLADEILGDPVVYPTIAVSDILSKELGSDWSVNFTNDSITIVSKFKVKGAGRVNTFLGGDPIPVEFKIRFEPAESDAHYRKILQRKLELANMFRAQPELLRFDGRKPPQLLVEFEKLTVPDFIAIDEFLFIDPHETGNGWVAYLDSELKTTDNVKKGVISPRPDYFRCMKAQAVIYAIFIPGPSLVDIQPVNGYDR